jgi:pyrroloquinoline quinone biosynthesis protein E
MHRQNLHQLPDIIQMALDLDADRLEVANVGSIVVTRRSN